MKIQPFAHRDLKYKIKIFTMFIMTKKFPRCKRCMHMFSTFVFFDISTIYLEKHNSNFTSFA